MPQKSNLEQRMRIGDTSATLSGLIPIPDSDQLPDPIDHPRSYPRSQIRGSHSLPTFRRDSTWRSMVELVEDTASLSGRI